MLSLSNPHYIAILWCLKLLLFVIYQSGSHNTRNKMSTPQSLDETTAGTKSPSSAKKPVAPGTPSPGQSAKPIKKKFKKTPQTDATSQGNPESPQEQQGNQNPASNQEPKTPEAPKGSKNQAVPDNASSPTKKSPGPQSADGAKKIMKKKPKPAADLDNNDVQEKQPQDTAKEVKKKTTPSATGVGDSKKPQPVKDAESILRNRGRMINPVLLSKLMLQSQ